MILRAYCVEEESNSPGISELLRENLLTTTAMVRLLAEGWYEPIRVSKMHASTLVQQLLSTISQYGGAHAQRIWDLLCVSGPFRAVTSAQFASLLRELAKREIIFQDPTGLLLLAPAGERITEHYTFYASFASEEEYSIVSGNQTLGWLPNIKYRGRRSILPLAEGLVGKPSCIFRPAAAPHKRCDKQDSAWATARSASLFPFPLACPKCQLKRSECTPGILRMSHFALSRRTGTLILCRTLVAVVPRNKSARKRWP